MQGVDLGSGLPIWDIARWRARELRAAAGSSAAVMFLGPVEREKMRHTAALLDEMADLIEGEGL